MQYKVAAFYKFVKLSSLEDLQKKIKNLAKKHNLLGTILLAEEGINSTCSGTHSELDNFIAELKSIPEFNDLEPKYSLHQEAPFFRLKVLIKKEIVHLGIEGIDPTKQVGTYIPADKWNELIAQEDVLLIDTRNDYETKIGTFQGAIDPKTSTFTEFPNYVKNNLDPKKHKKIAMYCTGGIRCEKATTYMLQQGFEQVYHLQGGILKYLEEIPENKSKWDGECFVFDNRTSVKKNLEQGEARLCFACRSTLSPEDMKSEHYVEGISCPYCYGKISDKKMKAIYERQKQLGISKELGIKHIGAEMEKLFVKKKSKKNIS